MGFSSLLLYVSAIAVSMAIAPRPYPSVLRNKSTCQSRRNHVLSHFMPRIDPYSFAPGRNLPLTVLRCPRSLAQEMLRKHLVATLAVSMVLARLSLLSTAMLVNSGSSIWCHSKLSRNRNGNQPVANVAEIVEYVSHSIGASDSHGWTHTHQRCWRCGVRNGLFFQGKPHLRHKVTNWTDM